jgi:thymidylate synthase (FAD)
MASFSVQSQRYVTEKDFEFVTPPQIAENEEASKLYLDTMHSITQSYNALADMLKAKNIQEGMDAKAAEKKAIEDARYVLPNACTTKMIVTMNARALHNFFKLRCCNRAQWEIRDLACKMLELVKEVAPNVFKNAGPDCVRGACSEGRMTCGQAVEMRKKFKGE